MDDLTDSNFSDCCVLQLSLHLLILRMGDDHTYILPFGETFCPTVI